MAIDRRNAPMGEKSDEAKKLIEKMRTNTEKQNRKTVAIPRRRTRKKAHKVRHKDAAAKVE